jgi:alkylhydroperoxidase family enzyme
MQARMKNPATILGDAAPPLMALGKILAASAIPEKTRHLVHIRTSQINGCAVCLDGEISNTKDTPQRLAAVAVWQDAPFFSDAERAALGLAEAITRLADQADRVPDAVWAEAARHYDETGLAWLVLDVSVLNLYNRLNVSTRQIAGSQSW